MIDKISCRDTPHGPLCVYEITNGSGASVRLSNLGAGILSIIVPDREGRMEDVVLGYADIMDYFGDGPCAGKTPGRYANRIAGGRFSLNGRHYTLPVNNGPNHLHGGPDGFANRLWEEAAGDDAVIFRLTSPEGDAGYPGTLNVEVLYSWSEENELTIEYRAVCDRDTVINLTNHTYFNLSGESSGTVLDHTLKLHASRWLPTDETLIPTGVLEPVMETPMDFSAAKRLGRDIHADFPALKFGKGYDNCWALDEWAPGNLVKAALLEDGQSGRRLEVFTTQSGVQIYTGNWLEGSPIGKGGRSYRDYDGLAIECQAFPDSPNKQQFPSTVLRPGEEYGRKIIFRFGTCD